jgi:hypothetical protein
MFESEFEANMQRLQEAEGRLSAEILKAKRSGDTAAYERARHRLVAGYQESRAALKAEGQKFEAEIKLDPGASDDAKVAQLLGAFERGERLACVWFDYMNSMRISSCCVGKIFHNIVFVLDAMNRRDDLVCFLDHPNPAVRARAAGCLMKKMPDRCLPILKEIYRAEGLRHAGRIASDWISVDEMRNASR